MSTRKPEHNRSMSTDRQSLLSAMRVYLTAPFFRRWKDWIGGRGEPGPGDGLYRISTLPPS